MSKKDPFPVDTDAFLADTPHLGTTAIGAYWLILMAMWRSVDGSLGADDVTLARTTRLTLDKWRRIAPAVRAFLVERDGNVTQKRVMKERRAKNSGESQNPSQDSGRASKPLKSLDPDSKTVASAETALSTSPSSFALSSESEDKERKKVRGAILPPDWTPATAERLYGRTVLKLTDAEIDAVLVRMKRWAINNAHRQVGRKPRWDLAFRDWLDRAAADRKPPPGPNGPPRGEARGNLSMKYANEIMEERHGTAPGFEDHEGPVSPEGGPRDRRHH